MLALSHFRDKAAGVPDLLNWAALIDDGVVQCKDGSLLAGWFYRGPDVASSTADELNSLTERVNAAMARLGGGYAFWVEMVRLPTADYPPAEASHFPDPISQAVENERRRQFESAGAHFETEHVLVVQYTPPLRRNTRVLDIIYDDDGEEISPATRILAGFQKALAAFEDSVAGVVAMRRLRSFVITDRAGREHLRDELVNFLHFALTGEAVSLNIPPSGAYLDCFLGGRELYPADMPRLGDHRLACVAIEGLPSVSVPAMLDMLTDLPIAFRWSSRFIFLDQHEAKAALSLQRRKWRQQARGFLAQVFNTQGGVVNEDALAMAHEAEASLSEASSGLLAFGYYTSVVVLRGSDIAELTEAARQVVRLVQSEGYTARIETVNAVEAWLGSLPGHPVPNVRRPLLHTQNLADALPLSSVWAGRDVNPCPLYPEGSPPLLIANTTGSTPFRVNLHVSDVGHTLVFGPTGAGKSVLLNTVALSALRYPRATVTAFDKGRSMLATVKACGGRHYDVATDGSLAFCPLSVLETEADAAWDEDWIATCYELQTEHSPSPAQRDAIHRAIALLREPGSERTITHFVAVVQDAAIREALQHYTITGALGGLLDAEHDGLTEGHFNVFEIEELMGMGERSLIPVLLYLFRRFEKSLKGQPAYLLLDEAWVMLGHPAFRSKIREWLKVLRKANCAVILATQSLSDASRSGILDVLIENCPTKIFLPNEEATIAGTPEHPGPLDLYRSMGLNDTQVEIIRSAHKKRHYYLVSPEGRRLFDLGLGPIAKRLAAVLVLGATLASPRLASAQMVCSNCATEVSELASMAKQAAQYAEQVQSYQLQLQQYANMITNTINIPQQLWAQVQSDLAQLQSLSNASSLLSGNSASIISRLQSAGGYANQVMNLGNVGSQFTQWQQTLGNSANTLGKLIGTQQTQEQANASLLNGLQSQSQTAVGQMQAIQAGNQIASQEAAQLQEIEQTLQTTAQTEATQMAVSADRQAKYDQDFAAFTAGNGVSTNAGAGF